MKPKTKVIFRMWKVRDSSCIAIFPRELGTNNPYTCSSYEHVGQHGACDPGYLMLVTRSAKPSEYRELARELRRRGYTLDIRHRIRQADLRHRENLLKTL